MIPHQNDAVMQKHVKQWQNSGLTQIAYCNNHNIKSHVFSYYKKKFGVAIKPENRLVKLIPVGIVAADDLNAPIVSPAASVIHINHSNGFSLEIHPGADLAYLKPLLELVGAI